MKKSKHPVKSPVTLVCPDLKIEEPAQSRLPAALRERSESSQPAAASQDCAHLPSDREALARIVGDPGATEEEWVAACLRAGDKSLVAQPALLSRAWAATLTLVGAVFAVLTLVFGVSCAMVLAGHLGWLGTGVEYEWFINKSGPGIGTGLVLGILSSVVLWISLLFSWKWIRRLAVAASCALLALYAVGCFGASVLAIGVAVVLTMAYTVALIATSWFGCVIREALPRSLSVPKVARSLLGALALPALLMALILWNLVSEPGSSGGPNDATMATLVVFLSVLAYCLVVPGLAVARSSGSRSYSACAALAVFLQIPVLLGIITATLLSAGTATIAFISPEGLPLMQSIFVHNTFSPMLGALGAAKALSLFAVFLMGLLLSLLGGVMGAAWNRSSKGHP